MKVNVIKHQARGGINMSFCANIPSWIISHMSEKKCKQCEDKVTKRGIVAFGIRKVDMDSDKDETIFFIEHKCSKCGFRSLILFDHNKQATIQEMSYLLLEHIQNCKKIQNSKNQEGINKHTDMTDNEVKEFITTLKTSDNHIDFLKEIGAISYHNMLENEKKPDSRKE